MDGRVPRLIGVSYIIIALNEVLYDLHVLLDNNASLFSVKFKRIPTFVGVKQSY